MKFILPLIALLLIFSCESNKNKESSNASEKPTVAVVNYPLYYYAKTIGGDHVNVYLPSIEGDPAYWQPDARQVNNFQNADIILANGAGYAKWMEKVSLPSSKIVNTSIEFKEMWIEINEGVSHSHGAEGEHVHKGTAFTTWLNFEFASLQLDQVYQSMIKLLPENEAEFTTNYKKLMDDLDDLHSDMQKTSEAFGEKTIIASHPVYQYLEEAYGLNMISLHWEPDEVPGDEEWENLAKEVEDHQVKTMIWEDEPLEEVKTKLEEIGLKVVVFNPCGNRAVSGDFLKVMKTNQRNLEKVFNTSLK